MPITTDEFKAAQDHAQQLQNLYSRRLSMLEEIEDIYLLNSSDLPDADWIKETLSPDGRNKVDGAKRLLTAADPKWSVPAETNSPDVMDVSERLERAAATTWRRAGSVQNRPRHYDPVLSGVLYGEVQMVLKRTADIAALAKGGAKLRAEAVAKQIPVLYDTVNPKYGYPSWDDLGLNAYASTRRMSVAGVRALYGPDVLSGRNATDYVDVWDYWCLDYRCAWVQGENQFLVAETKERAYLPIVAVQCEGSFLFTDDDQYQTQPLLYTVWRSNLWKRQNLYMTIAASLAFEIGANPLLVYQGDAESLPKIDFGSNPGGMIKIGREESITPLLQKILDPTLVQQAQEIDRRFDESTIYSQTLGEPLGANAPYSMVHLLSQAGRLPLVVYQRMISFALGQAMSLTFDIAREDNVPLMAATETGTAELKPAEIPEELDLRCQLDIDMPQDERMNVQIAVEGVKMGLFSLEYAQQKYLSIEQADSMRKQIAKERFAALAEEALAKDVAQMLARMKQQQQPPMQPDQFPPDMPPEQMPPEMPPELGPEGLPGLPMMEPTPPMGTPEGPGGMMEEEMPA